MAFQMPGDSTVRQIVRANNKEKSLATGGFPAQKASTAMWTWASFIHLGNIYSPVQQAIF